MTPSDFYSTHGVDPSGIHNRCYTSIPILEFLNGQPWDELALGLVMAFNPPMIRVTEGEVTTNTCPGRVTVYVGSLGYIKHIDQEIMPLSTDKYRCGMDYTVELRTRGC